MTEIDLKKFGGGFIDVFTQCCSDCGFEVFMTVMDYDEPKSTTAIMQPRFARKLAKTLLQVAEECDKENDSDDEEVGAFGVVAFKDDDFNCLNIYVKSRAPKVRGGISVDKDQAECLIALLQNWLEENNQGWYEEEEEEEED